MKLTRTYTCRGKITETESETGAPARIRLFDGSYETAFKVISFHVWSTSVSGSAPFCVGKLATSNALPNVQAADFFDASDSREIAWSQSSGATDGGQHTIGDNIVDPDNLIVEDLWVYVRANNDLTPINYMITLEKYDISETLGAVSMSRDRANESGERWIA